jgi:hypothetical protein
MMGNKRGVTVRHSPPNRSAEVDPTATGAANTAPKQPKRAAGFWPDDLRNYHLPTEGLQRAKEAVQKVVLRQVEADQFEYSSSSSKDAGRPGRRTTNTNQLWEEHINFINALLSYLSYGREESTDYYCPCSGSMPI